MTTTWLSDFFSIFFSDCTCCFHPNYFHPLVPFLCWMIRPLFSIYSWWKIWWSLTESLTVHDATFASVSICTAWPCHWSWCHAFSLFFLSVTATVIWCSYHIDTFPIVSFLMTRPCHWSWCHDCTSFFLTDTATASWCCFSIIMVFRWFGFSPLCI